MSMKFALFKPLYIHILCNIFYVLTRGKTSNRIEDVLLTQTFETKTFLSNNLFKLEHEFRDVVKGEIFKLSFYVFSNARRCIMWLN